MEPEGLLPHLQVPASCPYPEPARSIPSPPHPNFLKIHLNIILPSTLGSPKRFLSLGFPPPKPCSQLLSTLEYYTELKIKYYKLGIKISLSSLSIVLHLRMSIKKVRYMKLGYANHFAVSTLTLLCQSYVTGNCLRPGCEDVMAEHDYRSIHSSPRRWVEVSG